MLRHYFLNAVRSLRFCAVILSLWVGAAHAAPFAYITNGGSNDVSVIDIATNTVVATVPVGTEPAGIAINSAGTRIYVANISSNSVSVIDAASNTVVATVTTEGVPNGIAVNPSGTRAYVATGTGNISVIDTATNTVIANVAVGFNPFGVAVNPTDSRAYVTNYLSDSVSVVNTTTNTIATTVAAVASPMGVAINSAGTRAYVTNDSNANVSVIDTATNAVFATVAVGTGPIGVAVNPFGTRAYVTNRSNNNVSVIDTATNTIVATVAVGNGPIGVALDLTGTRAYVANSGSNNVSVIDTTSNTVVATVPVGTKPGAFGVFIARPPPVCYTAPSATGSGSVSACFTGGGPSCAYAAPQFIGAPPGVAPIPPTTPGPGIVFPHGLFDFSTSGCLTGNTLSFSITYPAALPPGTQYWKYGPTAANTTPHWYVLPATISGNTATFSITDGGLGDDDLVANGTIVDQGGPGAGSSSNSVPTLSEWAMGLLVLLMLLTVAARRYGARGEVRRVG